MTRTVENWVPEIEITPFPIFGWCKTLKQFPVDRQSSCVNNGLAVFATSVLSLVDDAKVGMLK